MWRQTTQNNFVILWVIDWHSKKNAIISRKCFYKVTECAHLFCLCWCCRRLDFPVARDDCGDFPAAHDYRGYENNALHPVTGFYKIWRNNFTVYFYSKMSFVDKEENGNIGIRISTYYQIRCNGLNNNAHVWASLKK